MLAGSDAESKYKRQREIHPRAGTVPPLWGLCRSPRALPAPRARTVPKPRSTGGGS